MKNYILIFAFLLCATSATTADDIQYEETQITLTIYKNSNSGNSERPRPPVRPPVVCQGVTMQRYHILDMRQEVALGVNELTLHTIGLTLG